MDKTEIHRQICNEMQKLYVTKNADYGDSFAKLRKEFGNIAILIRLSDKLERLKTLLQSRTSPNVSDESVDDTLLDLANYAVLELTERKNERTENLKERVLNPDHEHALGLGDVRL